MKVTVASTYLAAAFSCLFIAVTVVAVFRVALARAAHRVTPPLARTWLYCSGLAVSALNKQKAQTQSKHVLTKNVHIPISKGYQKDHYRAVIEIGLLFDSMRESVVENNHLRHSRLFGSLQNSYITGTENALLTIRFPCRLCDCKLGKDILTYIIFMHILEGGCDSG